eukprot:TRINITY_DN520_c0_g1_i8.p1 TRINITY_DN520_c0_g1~~TRINITY_DN520_c0_g1_i8.p1  ORF type:complete len:647 (+),score=43.06 TRINITY_DN520_c0_g1_i8:39-1979(+)
MPQLPAWLGEACACLGAIGCGEGPPQVTWEDPISTFYCVLRPDAPLVEYVRYLYQSVPCEGSWLVALGLISRVHRLGVVPLSPYSVHRVVLTALVVAQKMVSDRCASNVRYARVGMVGLPDLNDMERTLLVALNFDLFITQKQVLDALALYARPESIPPLALAFTAATPMVATAAAIAVLVCAVGAEEAPEQKRGRNVLSVDTECSAAAALILSPLTKDARRQGDGSPLPPLQGRLPRASLASEAVTDEELTPHTRRNAQRVVCAHLPTRRVSDALSVLTEGGMKSCLDASTTSMVTLSEQQSTLRRRTSDMTARCSDVLDRSVSSTHPHPTQRRPSEMADASAVWTAPDPQDRPFTPPKTSSSRSLRSHPGLLSQLSLEARSGLERRGSKMVVKPVVSPTKEEPLALEKRFSRGCVDPLSLSPLSDGVGSFGTVVTSALSPQRAASGRTEPLSVLSPISLRGVPSGLFRESVSSLDRTRKGVSPSRDLPPLVLSPLSKSTHCRPQSPADAQGPKSFSIMDLQLTSPQSGARAASTSSLDRDAQCAHGSTDMAAAHLKWWRSSGASQSWLRDTEGERPFGADLCEEEELQSPQTLVQTEPASPTRRRQSEAEGIMASPLRRISLDYQRSQTHGDLRRLHGSDMHLS